jgi:hypothetical protein
MQVIKTILKAIASTILAIVGSLIAITFAGQITFLCLVLAIAVLIWHGLKRP